MPGLGTEQSIFIMTKPKAEIPIAFNVAMYFFSSLICMSCPVRTIIRKKTKETFLND